MENLYPSSSVRWVAGPNENGADVIIEIPNHFGGVPWLLVIQVKNYEVMIDDSVLIQLKNAYEHYSKEGSIIQLTVITNADEESKRLIYGCKELEYRLKIPVKIILKREMMKLLSKGLLLNLYKDLSLPV